MSHQGRAPAVIIKWVNSSFNELMIDVIDMIDMNRLRISHAEPQGFIIRPPALTYQ
jgi:hypothetical protein